MRDAVVARGRARVRGLRLPVRPAAAQGLHVARLHDGEVHLRRLQALRLRARGPRRRQLGASCDWRRTRFTLDEVCSKAVRRTFFRFFKDGLIFRGKRLVNWDTHLQTAVANDEVFHEEVDGHFWTFMYPVIGDDG